MADKQQGTFAVKAGLAQMLKGGVIMDVTNVEEARIAEEAGAVAVMALERVPADIRRCAVVSNIQDAFCWHLSARAMRSTLARVRRTWLLWAALDS